jgi:hypothetical protein
MKTNFSLFLTLFLTLGLLAQSPAISDNEEIEQNFINEIKP